jgi:hypothetical protein
VSKKEVVNAIALEACGLRAELKRNDKATNAGPAQAEGSMLPLSSASLVRRLHSDNPLVFHNCRPICGVGAHAALSSSLDPLDQLTAFDLDEHDKEWARHQRIFILGSEMPAPNAFDESKSRKKVKRTLVRTSAPHAVIPSEPRDGPFPCAAPWHRRLLAAGAQDASVVDAFCDAAEASERPLPQDRPGSKKRRRRDVSTRGSAAPASADPPPGAPLLLRSHLVRPRIGVRRGRYAALLRLRNSLLQQLETLRGQIRAEDAGMATTLGAPEVARHLLSSIAWPLVHSAATLATIPGAVITGEVNADNELPSSSVSISLAQLHAALLSAPLAPHLGHAASIWCTMEYLRGDDVSSGLANANGSADSNDVTCSKCYCGGELVCCDTCPRSFHLSCAGLSLYEMPAGSWSCPVCKGKRSSARRSGVASSSAASGPPGLLPEKAEAILELAALSRAFSC